MKVYVDPRCIITYSSYYLYGLYEYFGKSNVRFSNKFFRDVDMSHYNHRNDALMLFVIIDELGSIKKVRWQLILETVGIYCLMPTIGVMYMQK